MRYYKGQPGVEYYDKRSAMFRACQVVEYCLSTGRYRIRVGLATNTRLVDDELLGIKWSVLNAQRKAAAL